MADLTQLTTWRDALLRARYAGIRTVEYDGKRVTYGSDAEMANALQQQPPQAASPPARASSSATCSASPRQTPPKAQALK